MENYKFQSAKGNEIEIRMQEYLGKPILSVKMLGRCCDINRVAAGKASEVRLEENVLHVPAEHAAATQQMIDEFAATLTPRPKPEGMPPMTMAEQQVLDDINGDRLPSSGRFYTTSARSRQPIYDLSPLDPAAERIG